MWMLGLTRKQQSLNIQRHGKLKQKSSRLPEMLLLKEMLMQDLVQDRDQNKTPPTVNLMDPRVSICSFGWFDVCIWPLLNAFGMDCSRGRSVRINGYWNGDAIRGGIRAEVNKTDDDLLQAGLFKKHRPFEFQPSTLIALYLSLKKMKELNKECTKQMPAQRHMFDSTHRAPDTPLMCMAIFILNK